MKPTLFEWLLLPFVLWGMFQGLLYFHANQVHVALNLAIYEGSKEAALEGELTGEIRKSMKSYLTNTFHYDASKIQITGTNSPQPRGEYLTIKITVPKPRLFVLPIFATKTSEDFEETKQIMSEYIP